MGLHVADFQQLERGISCRLPINNQDNFRRTRLRDLSESNLNVVPNILQATNSLIFQPFLESELSLVKKVVGQGIWSTLTIYVGHLASSNRNHYQQPYIWRRRGPRLRNFGYLDRTANCRLNNPNIAGGLIRKCGFVR